MTRMITLIGTTDRPRRELGLTTRPAGLEDAEALARLLFSSYEDGRVNTQEDALKLVTAVLDGSHGEFYPEASPVVEDDHGRIIAAALCLKNRVDGVPPGDKATIFELFTAASRRREGLAEKLIRQAVAQMDEDGFEEVTVRIPEANAAALALYLTLEFRRWQNPNDEQELV